MGPRPQHLGPKGLQKGADLPVIVIALSNIDDEGRSVGFHSASFLEEREMIEEAQKIGMVSTIVDLRKQFAIQTLLSMRSRE
jgi:hypothetical protein